MLTNLKSIAFTVLLLSCFAHAQTDGKGYANLKGTVIDGQNFPMPGASILIKIGAKTYGTTTDFDGKFLIKRIPSGSHSLKVTFIGYKPYSQDISLANGETYSLPAIELLETAEELKGVTVTGQSLGRLKALNVQRNAENIVDVVSLEQAEKIPDDNIADVLKRIAGVNVEIDQGEARTVSVRGLGPESVNILIDGERVASTSYSGSRAVELDLIPANVIQNVEVSKSVSADMDGESTGGTVNLITRSALSQKTQLTASAYRSFVTTNDIPGSTVDLNIARRFFDSKLGLSLNASSSRRNYKSDNIEADWSFVPAGVSGDFTDDTRYLTDFEIRQYWLVRVRHSFNVSADYEFNDRHQVGLKLSSSFRDDFENRYRVRLSSLDFPSGYDENNIYTTEGNLRLETTGGQNEGKPNSYRLDYKQTLYGKAWGEHLIGNTEVNWSASYSNSLKDRNRREIEYEATEGDFEVSIDIKNPSKPRFEIFNLTNLYNANLSDLETRKQYIDGKRLSLSFNVEHPTRFGYIKVGGRYRANERFEENNAFDYVPTGSELNRFGEASSIHYVRSGFYPGKIYESTFPVVSRTFLGSLDFDSGTAFIKKEDVDYRFDSGYDALEHVYAGYILTKIEFSDDFYIRAGMRYELTSSEYTSYRIDDIAGVERADTNKERYLNPLPSASLKYNITDDLTFRAGFSRTLRRPRHDYIAPRYRYTGLDSDGFRRLFRGNPDLKPSKTYNYDASFSYRIGQASNISVNGFLKRIDSFFDKVETKEDIGGGETLRIETPINIGTGRITGIEFSTQLNMVDVIHSLRNIDLYANLTLNDAYLNPGVIAEGFIANQRRNLGNAADLSYNFSAVYSSDRLELSGAIHSTSPFLVRYSSINSLGDRYYDKQFRVDVSLSCKLDEGLYLFANGRNLTNQPLRYYSGTVHYLEQEEYYGPDYAVGIRYKL